MINPFVYFLFILKGCLFSTGGLSNLPSIHQDLIASGWAKELDFGQSIAIGQKWQGDVRVVLFVRLAPGISLAEELAERIRGVIRANTTPRHVPARIVEVADIPRTKSGKLVELAVRSVVHGEPVNNLEALANPEALELFRGRPELDR